MRGNREISFYIMAASSIVKFFDRLPYADY